MSATPASPDKITHRLRYTGRAGELLLLSLVNAGLTIITLGAYRFWGKAAVRRYLWGHLYFRGEPFTYTGEGQELLKGFVRLLLLFIPLVVLWQALAIFVAQAAFESIGVFLMLATAIPFVTFATRRYRLSCSDWRCIRFCQSGSARIYMLKSLRGSALNWISLYYYAPVNAVRLMGYQLNHLRFGDMPVVYRGRVPDLRRAYNGLWWTCFGLVMMLIVSTGTLGVMSVRFFGEFRKGEAHSKSALLETFRQSGLLHLVGFCGVLWLVLILTFIFARIIYRLRLYRHVAKSSTLGGMSARFDVSFWRYLWLRIGNGLLILFSLGILSPLAAHRRLRFLTRGLVLQGMPNLAAVRQAETADRSGEGGTQWFDVEALDV